MGCGEIIQRLVFFWCMKLVCVHNYVKKVPFSSRSTTCGLRPEFLVVRFIDHVYNLIAIRHWPCFCELVRSVVVFSKHFWGPLFFDKQLQPKTQNYLWIARGKCCNWTFYCCLYQIRSWSGKHPFQCKTKLEMELHCMVIEYTADGQKL